MTYTGFKINLSLFNVEDNILLPKKKELKMCLPTHFKSKKYLPPPKLSNTLHLGLCNLSYEMKETIDDVTGTGCADPQL